MKSDPNKLTSIQDPLTQAMREQSTHQSADTRITVYERLGLNKPGFWADYGSRRLDTVPKMETPDSGYQPYNPTIKPLPELQVPEWEESKPQELPKFKKPDVSVMTGGQGTGGTATGRTKAQLRKTEMAVLSGTIKFNIESHPMLTTTVLDTMTATQINMDRQMSMWMEDNPSKMLSDATVAYYNDHPPDSAAGASQTNFEKTTSLYSETKKKASKKKDYAAAEANKAIAKAKTQSVPSAPKYSGQQLNIGSSGGYGSTQYFSSFG